MAANWRLFCPQAWDPATIGETDRAQAVRDKRARAGIPDEIGHREKRAEGGGLPEQWLIAEWPPDEPEPVRYWLSNMDRRTSLKSLVLLAKIRWRVEHDYRELKTGLGIDHFEGRSFTAGTATSPSPCSLKPSSPCYALDPKADTPA